MFRRGFVTETSPAAMGSSPGSAPGREADVLLLFLVGSVALQVWAWQSLGRRVASAELTRLAGVLRYGTWALAPLAAFLGLFFALVGLEELLGAAMIAEPMGRAVVPLAALLLAMALLGWLLFSIGCVLRGPAPGAKA